MTRFVWLRQFKPGSNSADANRLLDRLEIPAKFLAHVSPLGWAHNQPDRRIPLAGHRPTGNAKRLA